MANSDTRSDASSPSSQSFDPGALAFVPTCASRVKHDSSTPPVKTSSSFQDSANGVRSIARRAARPPLALYSSSTWSPVTEQAVKSAGVPAKQSWDTFLAGENPTTSLLSPAHAQSKRSVQVDNPQSAIYNDNLKYIRGDNGRILRANPSPSTSNLHYTQTEEYHTSAWSSCAQASNSLTIKTDPLPQHAFIGTAPTTAATSSAASIFSQHGEVPQTPLSAMSQSFNEGKQPKPDDQKSDGSGSITISDHYTVTHPEKAGVKGEVWTERAHPDGLRRALKDGNVEWTEAYQGAVTVLSALNPAVYQMPFGTRVINIKTEYYRNLLKSVQSGKYAVMAKVAQRIMKFWDSRADATEKVLLLFSINGSKRFCGLAEMAGPWNKDESITGWDNVPGSDPSVGTFNVTWIYVKDVAYHKFGHIRQPSNGHPVGNMWNGMNFPSELGRQVIQCFVETPSTSSILGQPRGAPDSSHSMNRRPNRGNFNNGRHSRGGRSGVRSGPNAIANWRQHNGPHGSDPEHETKSVPGNTEHDDALDTTPQRPERLTEAKAATEQIDPLKLFSIKVDEHGKLVLVQADEATQRAYLPKSTNLAARQKPESLEPQDNGSLEGRHASRSVGELHQADSSTSSLRASAASSSRALILPNLPTAGATQHYPVMPPHFEDNGYGFHGSSGYTSMQRLVEETPTHRPLSRGARSAAQSMSQHSSQSDLPLKDMSANMLNARYHRLTAEVFALTDELSQANLSEMRARMANARMCRLLTEKREVQEQLSTMGYAKNETMSPVRRDSLGSGDQVSTSTGYQISPVRAEDGRRLRSVSKTVAPREQSVLEAFDPAPGGSGRQKGHAHKDSWDLQTKKSIADLLKSPEKTPSAARPAHQSSNFFANSSSKPSPLTLTKRSQATPSAAHGGIKHFNSFSGLGGSGCGTPVTSPVFQSFTFSRPPNQGSSTPSGSICPPSFTFSTPTGHGGSTPSASDGARGYVFPTLPSNQAMAASVQPASTAANCPITTNGNNTTSSKPTTAPENYTFYGPGGVRLNQ